MRDTLCLTSVLALAFAVGCAEEPAAVTPASPFSGPGDSSFSQALVPEGPTLSEARAGFQTVIVREDPSFGPPDVPTTDEFLLTTYTSPVGELAAYVTPDPGDGGRHPAIIWIVGGECNSIGDVWSPSDPSNDQTARAFREHGIVMMFPSLRGGNDNPGQREGFYGEVDDVLAAADYLAQLSYVDPERIYLGGHSTGGTLALLTAECSDRFEAVFSFGPVAAVLNYGGDYYYADVWNAQETSLRDPGRWLSSITSPVYIFEGQGGNWDAVVSMQRASNNPLIQFYVIQGHDHFTVLHPLTNVLAEQIVQGEVQFTQEILQGL
jgi:alpha/beta superfamily hydrolase